MRTETEIAVILLPSQECQEPPEAGREAWNYFSLRGPGRNQPCKHFNFRFPAFRTVRINVC